MDIQISGLEQVQKALANAPKTIVITTFARALDAAAGVIAAEVAARVDLMGEFSETPLADHILTKVELDTDARGGNAVVGFDKSIDERTGVPQDAKAYWIEFGHRIVTHKPALKDVGEVKEKPFMRETFDVTRDKAIEVFAETVIANLPATL